jgi:hypothetical protein
VLLQWARGRVAPHLALEECEEFMNLLDFCYGKYLCIFSVFIYAFRYAPIFLAQLF